MYDLVIIGGGPGGIAAGVYAARKKIKSAIVAGDFGGASKVSADIQNWIGTKSISGYDWSKTLEGHLRAQQGIDVIHPDLVEKVEKIDAGFSIKTKSGKLLESKTILVTTGSARKKLNIPGEKEFDGKGVVYCSTCDAPIFAGKTVAVVGGGNAGLEAVLDADPYATKIYILEFSDQLKGDAVTQEKLRANPKVEIITGAKTLEIIGDKFVSGLKYEDIKSGEVKELKLEGVFVEIGAYPNVGFVKELVKTNDFGEIVVDHKTQATSMPGIWAAGDASDVLYKQNNISSGDAIKAVLNIVDHLNKTESQREYSK
ncbi:MAG: alkyl hydroperoxide reductase subunit F [Parcubacteria group bacterium Gr01-1014_19]|nr:MAG: alkyl hydroperoxide reductase subunit F [Parcubacteria group bacterium Gr01-1014_19]